MVLVLAACWGSDVQLAIVAFLCLFVVGSKLEEGENFKPPFYTNFSYAFLFLSLSLSPVAVFTRVCMKDKQSEKRRGHVEAQVRRRRYCMGMGTLLVEPCVHI